MVATLAGKAGKAGKIGKARNPYHPNQYLNAINQLSASEQVPSESFHPFLKFDLSQWGSGGHLGG